MPEANKETQAERRFFVSTGQIVFNIVSGILLTALTYLFANILQPVLTDKVEIYAVQMPSSADKNQLAVVIDNYSTNNIDIKLTLRATDLSIVGKVNMGDSGERKDANSYILTLGHLEQ